jgi:CRISPR-associated protein Csm3
MKLHLKGYIRVNGEITCLTGLHIGNPSEVIEIGGLENAIIKHPVSGIPYIPGSSLKGKMRALLELWSGRVDVKGDVHSPKNHKDLAEVGKCPICRIFGVIGGAKTQDKQDVGLGPSRLVVEDARLVRIEADGYRQTDLAKTEVKWANVINRISGTAEHPRQMERVPAGAVFEFAMNYRAFEMKGDDGQPLDFPDDEAMFEHVLKAMRLLELDTLGGSGSRGYGKVSFGEVQIVYPDGRTETKNIGDVTP